jgi:leucyl aminopeptidase
MHPSFVHRGGEVAPIPILFTSERTWPSLRQELDGGTLNFVNAAGFEPKAGRHLLLPGANGIAAVLFGLETTEAEVDPFLPGRLPGLLPAGTYRFGTLPPQPRLAALAFALGSYRFGRYRKNETKDLKLEVPEGVDLSELSRMVEGVTLARDLINTPANDLGPAELEGAAHELADRHHATCRSVIGEELLAQRLPLIHAVGRASSSAPRLIDLSWGDPAAPKVTLIGKGVTFDTGGLDLKTESGMLIMKKDMGGAANVLALAHMVMDCGLKLRLRVLIPAVENAISGSAFRPLDVYSSRKGLTVEIGNTDAEGRLVLADALAVADEEAPEVIIDMATLTGAARVALGPDLPPFYTEDDAIAAELLCCATAENDPLWRLPLWRGYDSMLESKVADLKNVGASTFAGSITAALFLKRFVANAKTWIHLDVYAWTPSAKPGRPEGGECQAARALYAWLKARYGGSSAASCSRTQSDKRYRLDH